MTSQTIASVLIHVSDVATALQWYQRAFPQAVACRLDEFDFDYLRIGTIDLEIVPADEKVASGAAGSVVYWQVDDFDQAVAHMLSVGGVLYRGPLNIQGGLRMCQIRDPWGNCIGLRG